MKKILSLIFMFVSLISSCSEEEMVKTRTSLSDTLKFTASFESNESRTYIDKDNLLHWTEGDKISLFAGNTLNRQYQFEGKTGDNYGTFSAVSNPLGESSSLNKHYAIYPYTPDIKITESGIITVNLPEEQKYGDWFTRMGDNTMVAVTQDTDDTFLKFKNVCGYLKLQLYGDGVTVKSITLRGNSDEKIAGKATITPTYDGEPSVNVAANASEIITLNCGDGVKLGTISMAATDFWIIVPPTTFKKGFTITIKDTNGDEFSKSVFDEVCIERNVITSLSEKKIVFDNNNLDTDSALNNIWTWMIAYGQASDAHDDFGYMSSLHATDMMCEDVVMGASHWFSYDHQLNNNKETYRRVLCNWTNYYTMITKANDIISLYPEGGNTIEERGWLGQAQAIRGLAYLHLIQLFQFASNTDGTVNTNAPGVPLIYTEADGYTPDEITAFKGRNTVGQVMEQIEKDLTAAVANLEFGYRRPNKNYIDVSVANGILARYYLLANKWQQAADAANKARQGYPMMSADVNGLYDGFVTLNNAEWMWGFAHTIETQTSYASFFSMISNIAPGYAGLGYAPHLVDARLYSQIPETDARKKWFNGPKGDTTQPTFVAQMPYANVKFGHVINWTSNYMYMRAAEMVLIEAEAYAHMGNESKAAEVLKVLMNARQPDWNKTSVTVDDIHLQRRIELWGEGFAYYDLKRLNKGIDRTYEGNNYMDGYDIAVPARDTRWIYQIPKKEIEKNDMLNETDQNVL